MGVLLSALLSITRNVEFGFFLIIFLIPQPNIWYKIHKYPFGKDTMDILIISMILGIISQKKIFQNTFNGSIIAFFIIVSYVSLWNCSFNFSLPLPITTDNSLLLDWKNYVEMIFLYFLAFNIIKDERKQKIALTLMAIVVLLLAVRSYRNFSGGASFSYDKRAGGPFEIVGLGANHFGAFIADYCSLFFGLFLFDKNRIRKWLFITTVLFGIHPLFYSYSRGAYLAAFVSLVVFGILKKRSLLILVVVIFFAWQTILPVSVVERITMTESSSGQLEDSAAHRLNLWEHALDLFNQNPLFGVGFNGFGFTVPSGELTDTHNLYLKVLSEQGLIGICLLLIIFIISFRSGWLLYRIGRSDFHKGLGLGFIGCITAVLITNIFGDRWSYFILGSYFWIFWGLVDRGILIAQENQ